MGKLTTHVLDSSRGKPGAGIPVTLYAADQERQLLCTMITNSDGRCDAPLLADHTFATGTYEIEFNVADYFDGAVGVSDPPFLDIVTLRFTITEDQHYHVPLLVSPWSYSTYRGS